MIDLKERISWIDVLKGLAIIFVVLGHNAITTTHSKVFNIIFSFHIPLFFFASGCLFNPDSAGAYLFKRRFNSLIRPYFFTVICISLVYILVKRNPSTLWYIFWTVYGNGPNLPKIALHLWFLPSLLITTVLAWFAFKYVRALNNYLIIQILFILGLLVAGYFLIGFFWDFEIPSKATDFFITNGHQHLKNGLLDNPAYSNEQLLKGNEFILKGLPWGLDISFLTVAFFFSGYVIKKNQLEKFFRKPFFALLSLLVFCLIHYFYNFTIDLNLRRYDHLLICSLAVYTGIYICVYASNIIGRQENGFSKAIQYIGKYSLIIFIFHPIIESRFYNMMVLVLPKAIYIAYATAFMAGLILPLFLNYLLLERFKFFRSWYYAK